MADESKSLEQLLKEWAALDAELERYQRLVTVMFTDIAGSTKYFDEHGDLAGMAMLTEVNDSLQPRVQQHHGAIVKTIGDAIMAYFENPLEAVRCAMAMQQGMAALNQQRPGRQPIQIRVALNLGVGLLKDNDVFGDVVNVCSRIEKETRAGQIGVSPSVVEAVSREPGVACRKIGAVALGGKVQKMDLYEVLWQEGVDRAGAQPEKLSGDQLALATGTVVRVDEDVRAAIAEALKGKAAKLAPIATQFVLIEEKPGGELGQRYPLLQGRLLVGREKGDILFSGDSMISAQHAMFTVLGGGLYVEDLGSTHGVFVRIREPFDLQDGDTLLMGQQVFRFRLSGEGSGASGELVPLREGQEEEKRYPLQSGENTFGRTQGTHSFPDNPYLSRLHARITIHGSYCVLEDMKSTNGTFVRIRARHLLDVDDVVLVGRQCLRVQAEPASAQTDAAPMPASPGGREPEPVAAAAPETPALAPPPAGLAVLEFQNLSGDPSVDWLGTGMAETLSADLQKLKLVRVVGRERAQQVLRRLGREASPAEVGRALRARWVVTGGFQRAGDRIRITPRVLEAASDEEIASSKVDGKWENLFTLQDRVVVELMAALQLKLDSAARKRIAPPETRQLEAYEHYAQGRQRFNELGKNSLEEARQHFERAVALDSDYAMAYSALGATHAMRYVHRTDPEDLSRAGNYLERALELDAELAEPYPWLCYIYSRQGKLEQALSAGLKGTELQPDLVQAHYFLGCAYLFNIQQDRGHCQRAVACLQQATAVEPRWVASWLVLSWIALAVGDYDRAEQFATREWELERAGDAMAPFPGTAAMLLGGVWLRRGQWEKARQQYLEALKLLAGGDHMYRDAFVALSACGLGDVQLRQGQAEAALAEFRRARHTVQEFPRMLGSERVLTRVLAGMAAAYAAGGEADRARQLAGEADTHLQTVAAQPHTWIWEAATSQLYHALAVARRHLREDETALALLEKAVETGWQDAAWLETDPALAGLRDQARFRALLEDLRQRPALAFQAAEPATVF
ncbi:MAG TPA: FHA domain-containing protein [Candidatus Acidoferrales bacterium]|nr:FHA domain-containing protein [Candidatus Acidoferrales bacterium]